MNMTLLWQGLYQGGVFRKKKKKKKEGERNDGGRRGGRREEGAEGGGRSGARTPFIHSLAEEGKRATLSESKTVVDDR